MKEMQYIAIEQLHPHPDNPRKDLGDLTELAASIKQSGIYQNLTVIPCEAGGYTVVIGHRRRAAAEIAGLTELPCVITEMSYKEQLSTMLLENMQRTDLTIYEQAQGFQMMLDLGDSIADISTSTGFSETTVRRRVKLLELDKEKFEKATARGATLFDFAELNKVKSVDKRNELLAYIGTPNFNNKLKTTLENEKSAERLMELKSQLDVFAFQIERPNEFGGVAVEMYCVESWYGSSAKDVKIPEDSENVRYFYTFSGGFSLTLYREGRREINETPEEREKRRLRELNREHESFLQEVTERHYELRADFVKNFAGGKTGADIIAAFAAELLATNNTSHYYNTRKRIFNLLGIECDEEDEFAPEYVKNVIARNPHKALLATIAGHIDGSGTGYWRNQWKPDKQLYEIEYAANTKLDDWYDFLCYLGYEMSDEEREMQDGSSNYLRHDFVESIENDEETQ